MANNKLDAAQIQAALDAKIITAEQAKEMRADLDAPAQNTPAHNTPAATDNNNAAIGHEDNMRFLRSFSDVFIAIGLVLMTLGLSGVTKIMGGGVLFLGAAMVMWLGAEFFGRKKRAHLPTLILALGFLIFVQRGFGALLGGGGSLAALVTLGAMAVFYWRIRLPFCIALIAASALFLLFTLLDQYVPGLTKNNLGPVIGLAGLAVFGAALAYDVNDEHRTTRFADNACWLHFLAAPLIIHGIAITGVSLKSEKIFGLSLPSLGTGDAVFVLIIFALLTFVGLAINRRALIVSALGYAGFAITSLFIGAGMGLGTSLLVALLVLGGAIVFLGVGWHGARDILLKVLPKWRIFPPPFDPNYKS